MPKPTASGSRFGRLTLVKMVGRDRYTQIWECTCDCGSVGNFGLVNILRGHTKSCGCLQRERTSSKSRRHGLSSSSEYSIWNMMIQRCHNPKNQRYSYYGGRGIKVCDRWHDSFASFLADMGSRPSPLHSIDRWPDNNGDYEPGNCRWATKSQQARNTRFNRMTEMSARVVRRLFDLDMPASSIAAVFGVNKSTVNKIKYGETWS